MVRSTRLLFAAIAAASLLAVLVTTASAGVFRVSSQRFRATWTAFELREAFFTYRCALTLEGSYHSATIRKVAGALMGHISRATTVPSACTAARVTVNQEPLPWPILYRGFSGMLPNINSLEMGITVAKFEVDDGFGRLCITGSEASRPLVVTAIIRSGTVSEIRFNEEFTIPWRTSFFCQFVGGPWRAGGTGAFKVLGDTRAITVVLI